MTLARFYPIGTPGQPWGEPERDRWRASQTRQRSYADQVLSVVQRLGERFHTEAYGQVVYGEERFNLMALRSRHWQASLPGVLLTGGVHGYETSGVLAALRFASDHAAAYEGRLNLLIAPCVSPWAWERVQRWNHDAIDPNRSFRDNSPAQESAALMQLVRPLRGQFLAHIDLHETTDTDESEFRPALAARDGKPFEPCSIPDGFYLVDDAANPQPAFQQAIVQAVQRVTHIAPADAQGGILGSPLVSHGVIEYPMQTLGLCACITGARYTTTTEVYPDSPGTTPALCIAAQVAAVCAALEFVCVQG